MTDDGWRIRLYIFEDRIPVRLPVGRQGFDVQPIPGSGTINTYLLL